MSARGHDRDPLHGYLGDELGITQGALQAPGVEMRRPQAGCGVVEEQALGILDARVQMKPAAHAHQDTIPDDPVQDALEGGRGHARQESPQVRSAEKISLRRRQTGELLLIVCGRLHDQILQKVSYFTTFRRPA